MYFFLEVITYNPSRKCWNSSRQMTSQAASLKTKTAQARLPPAPHVNVDENLEKTNNNNNNEYSIVPSSFLITSALLFRIASLSLTISRGGGHLHWLLFIVF